MNGSFLLDDLYVQLNHNESYVTRTFYLIFLLTHTITFRYYFRIFNVNIAYTWCTVYLGGYMELPRTTFKRSLWCQIRLLFQEIELFYWWVLTYDKYIQIHLYWRYTFNIHMSFPHGYSRFLLLFMISISQPSAQKSLEKQDNTHQWDGTFWRILKDACFSGLIWHFIIIMFWTWRQDIRLIMTLHLK